MYMAITDSYWLSISKFITIYWGPDTANHEDTRLFEVHAMNWGKDKSKIAPVRN
jgi:hypothetical protein